MYRLLLLILLVFTTGVAPSLSQFWEATSGPPASTTALISNRFGWVFAGTTASAVYRTTNWGETWTRHDDQIDDFGIETYRINQLAVGAGDLIYAAVNDRGVYRSTNFGTNWELLNLGLPTDIKVRLSVSTKVTGSKTEVFVGYDGGVGNLHLRYSDNGGNSFQAIPTTALPGAVSSIFETFLSPNSEKMFVLVSYNKGLYRSTNKGVNWTRIDSDPQSGESDDNFLTMRAAPNGVLYLGRNALPSSTKTPNAVVMRSSNDGESWEYLLDGWDNTNVTNNKITGISFGAGNDVWVITEKSSGVFFSSNGGDSWTKQTEGLSGDGSGLGIVATIHNHVFVSNASPPIMRHLDPAASVDHLPGVVRAVTTAPNPTTDVVNLNVSLEKDALVSAELLTLSGTRVVEPYLSRHIAGESSVRFATSELAQGVYVWTLKVGNDVKSGTVVVTR